eukprot:5136282-Prymnesium_polylepis.1
MRRSGDTHPCILGPQARRRFKSQPLTACKRKVELFGAGRGLVRAALPNYKPPTGWRREGVAELTERREINGAACTICDRVLIEERAVEEVHAATVDLQPTSVDSSAVVDKCRVHGHQLRVSSNQNATTSLCVVIPNRAVKQRQVG